MQNFGEIYSTNTVILGLAPNKFITSISSKKSPK